MVELQCSLVGRTVQYTITSVLIIKIFPVADFFFFQNVILLTHASLDTMSYKILSPTAAAPRSSGAGMFPPSPSHRQTSNGGGGGGIGTDLPAPFLKQQSE